MTSNCHIETKGYYLPYAVPLYFMNFIHTLIRYGFLLVSFLPSRALYGIGIKVSESYILPR